MTLTLPTTGMIALESVSALRWGVIGTGIVAQFVAAMHEHSTQRDYAVTSTDLRELSSRASVAMRPTDSAESARLYDLDRPR
ncbi:MAG TPA: hypothetical protein VIL68_03210 [Propionibacteriaceae bacterium]|jgi:predicted dehydrogenase